MNGQMDKITLGKNSLLGIHLVFVLTSEPEIYQPLEGIVLHIKIPVTTNFGYNTFDFQERYTKPEAANNQDNEDIPS